MASHNQHRHLSQEQMPFHLFTDQTAPPEFRTILPDYLREQQAEAAQKEDWPRRHHLGTGPNWLGNTILRPQTTTYGTVNVQNNQNSNNITASNNFLNLYSKFDSSAASQQTSNQWLSRTTIEDSVLAPFESLGLSSNNNDSNEINYINNKDNGNNCGSKDELTEDELDVGVDGGGGDGMSVVNWQNTKRKAEILAHPLYGQLLSAHVACLRIATPVDQLPRIHAQLAHSQHVVAKYSKFGNGQTMVGDDEELDQFMTHYVLLLCSFREQLQQHIRVNAIEAIMACWEIEQSFQSLTGVSAGEGTGESISDDDDYPEDNSDTNLFDGLDGPHSMGFGPPIPIESERSLIEHVRQELMHELKQGYKEKIVDVREEILRKRRVGRLPGDTTSVLKAWWQSHSKWPYPTLVTPRDAGLMDLNDTVVDVEGEEPHTGIIVSISNDNPAHVSVVGDERLVFLDGDLVVSSEVIGMTKLHDGNPQNLKNASPYSFTLNEDTIDYGTIERGGIVTSVQQPKVLKFNPLQVAFKDPGDRRFGEIDHNVLGYFTFGAGIVLNSMTAMFGDIIGQDVVKACIGSSARRYDFLKYLALMGVSCGDKGKLTIPADDIIEESNRSRHFHFRDWNIGQAKSIDAAVAAVSINPRLPIEAYQNRASPGTENVFDDTFQEDLDVVVNSLDNVNARFYSDQRYLYFQQPSTKSFGRVVAGEIEARLGNWSCNPVGISEHQITARQEWTSAPVQLQTLECIFCHDIGTPSKQMAQSQASTIPNADASQPSSL